MTPFVHVSAGLALLVQCVLNLLQSTAFASIRTYWSTEARVIFPSDAAYCFRVSSVEHHSVFRQLTSACHVVYLVLSMTPAVLASSLSVFLLRSSFTLSLKIRRR